MIIRYKVPVSMSGINLFRKDREWMVGLGQEHPEPDSKEILPPFNGVRDTFFFVGVCGPDIQVYDGNEAGWPSSGGGGDALSE